MLNRSNPQRPFPRLIRSGAGPRPANLVLALGLLACAAIRAQSPPTLTLQQAEAMALQNHPQIQAAQHEAAYAGQQITITKSAYYPQITGDLTGSQGNDNSRIGAGDLAASRLFDRFGQGVVAQQLITDSGRTPSLVASSRLQAQASQQDLQASRYDVLLQVNRAYFGVQRAQATVKVAQETVAARQTLDDQVTQLAKNQLRSQLDVEFADVQVSQAKLLLLQAQEEVQQALAELGAALGTDQPANYQLADEPMPASPPESVDDLIAQAVANRPELASLKLARDAANKFAEAEKDLSRPTVSAIAVGGFLPLVKQEGSTTIPAEYEGVGANVSIPVFNGHLFAARRAAAQERALESDQKLRDQQDRIFRDVRVAVAGALTAYQRIDVTAQFLRSAALAIQLAQGRYDLQLASIVELTQAQLQLTEAEIANLNAKYDYQSQNSLLQYTIGLLR
jgi:outer membrane protein